MAKPIDTFKAFLYNSYLQISTHKREFTRWRAFTPSASVAKARVFYGHEHIPTMGERASGGIIKCQDLQEDYPNATGGADVLYLVSSALPQCPEIIVHHAKKRGAKLVVNQNGVAFPAYHGNRIELINRIRRWLLEQADFVIYQSEYCKLSADRWLTDKVTNFTILHNPVDTGFFVPETYRQPTSEPVLLMAGSHGFFYRLESGVATLAALRKQGVAAKLKIYGRLAWKQDQALCAAELQNLCTQYAMEPYVELGAPYKQLDAPSIYQNADILVHTQYNDACPRTVVEAMACGLPVVYSKSGGTPELVGDNAGRPVSVPLDWNRIGLVDPRQMADEICAVLKEHKNYAEAARRRACEQFDVDSWREQHKEIFERITRITGKAVRS